MIQTVSVNEFKKLIDTKNYDEIIDIRTLEELEYFGVIPWFTKHLDVYTKLDEILLLDKNKKYLIYCYHWNRSWMLLQYMQMEGFENVVDLMWWTDARVSYWFNLISYKK